ncbi:acyl carrier protein [Lachnospiraceae bacterium KH1T2]|nr:acyl carrier protein [Lachnospiraceae bacterium KH1T2]
MNNEKIFKDLIAQYSDIEAKDITNEMSFRDELGLSSLDFMSFLGDLEDTFDIELDEKKALEIKTVGDAFNYLDSLQEAVVCHA